MQFTLCLKYDAKLLHFVETTRAFGEKFAEEWLFMWLLVFIGQKKRQSYRLACLWVWKK